MQCMLCAVGVFVCVSVCLAVYLMNVGICVCECHEFGTSVGRWWGSMEWVAHFRICDTRSWTLIVGIIRLTNYAKGEYLCAIEKGESATTANDERIREMILHKYKVLYMFWYHQNLFACNFICWICCDEFFFFLFIFVFSSLSFRSIHFDAQS